MSDPTHIPPAAVERTRPTEQLHPLVEQGMAAMRTHPDPLLLRELLAVQREWEAGEARKLYTAAMVALKRDLPTVLARDRVVDYQGGKGRVYYTHVSLAAVIAAVTDHLGAHGFSLGYEVAAGPGLVTVRCRLTHAAGHSEATELSAPPDTAGGKGPAQAIASTITLLQRYTAMALLGLASADQEEPAGESAAPNVDPQRNLAAAGWLDSHGYAVPEFEARFQRAVQYWTAADLDEIRGLKKGGG